MIQKKIIHIHTDPKFLFHINGYSSRFFDNRLVFLGNPEDLDEEYKKNTILLPPSDKERHTKLKQICEDADLITISYLSTFCVDFVLSLPDNIKIIWRFFGLEIYSKERKLVYSKLTLKVFESEIQKLPLIIRVKYFIWNLLYKNDTSKEDNFKLALKRIDYFLGIMDDEYELLKFLGYDLPPFIQVPMFFLEKNQEKYNKSQIILFGNGRNQGNNHLDILELFKKINLPKSLQIKMFFSYGQDGNYSLKVRRKSEQIEQIEIIEQFFSNNEFESLYKAAAAFIFNGYRQMAIGNILAAVNFGVKIYLSEKNVSYKWLLKNDFIIHSIEKDLSFDLNNNNIYLSLSEIQKNYNSLKAINHKHSMEKFQSRLLSILEK